MRSSRRAHPLPSNPQQSNIKHDKCSINNKNNAMTITYPIFSNIITTTENQFEFPVTPGTNSIVACPLVLKPHHSLHKSFHSC